MADHQGAAGAEPSAGLERPLPGLPTIGVDGELPVLRELLEIERERLRQALALEAKRSIVFPETTVILHDVERLLAKVREKERAAESRPASQRKRGVQ